ncbi:hypothetical protein MRB53_002915 [Persea americana]|uniref:Uncharacterized protein n=1 Tax=Persea americana TaxID=3435 RepID=A0ACC2MY87_PERAE|nr:hypothetical protein MRB53_002915 [Persea americana]
MQDFIPGPEDKSILFEQENHISKEVWDGKVDRFLDWQLESFEKLEKMADSSQMNSFVKSMQRNVEMFKKAWSSGFVIFNVENCINSTFDEKGKADVRSSSPNTPIGSRDGVYGLSPDPHTSTHMFYSSHFTMTPIHVSTPQSVRSQIPVNLSTPQKFNFDRGIFTMANAEHASYRRAIEYTQADIWSRQNDIQKAEENEDNENIKCYEAEPSLEFVEDVSHHVTRNLTIDDGECASVSNGAHEKAISSDLQTSISSEAVKPCGHMMLQHINSCMVVSRDTLYIYGGMMEVRDREITLDDLYMLNLSKLDKWKCIIPDDTQILTASSDQTEIPFERNQC